MVGATESFLQSLESLVNTANDASKYFRAERNFYQLVLELARVGELGWDPVDKSANPPAPNS